jgi:hypothetical protein
MIEFSKQISIQFQTYDEGKDETHGRHNIPKIFEISYY